MGTRSKQMRLARGPTPRLSTVRAFPDYLIPAPDGSGDIGINLAKLQAPSDVYDGDFAWAEKGYGSINLLFAKAGLSSRSELKSKLEIRMSAENFVMFWRHTQNFYGILKNEHLARIPKIVASTSFDPQTVTAKSEHSTWASIVAVSYTGGAASADFFLIPPNAIGSYQQTNDPAQLVVTPVLRALFGTHALLALLESCRGIAAEVEPMLPKEAV